MSVEKKPPLKLDWFEEVTDWLATRLELPEGVSRPGMTAVVAMVMRATTSETSEALVSARWVETMTGVNRGSALRALAHLEETGWLRWTYHRRNRVKVYTIAIPQVVTHPHHLAASGDASGDGSGDDYSHTPVLPYSPRDAIKRRAGEFCPNCERIDRHDHDCAHRPFEDDISVVQEHQDVS